jgi:hypothetical protein
MAYGQAKTKVRPLGPFLHYFTIVDCMLMPTGGPRCQAFESLFSFRERRSKPSTLAFASGPVGIQRLVQNEADNVFGGMGAGNQVCDPAIEGRQPSAMA